MAHNAKYTKEQIETATKTAQSYSDIFRNLGITVNGGSYNWIKKTLKNYEISVSHFPSKNVHLIKGGLDAMGRTLAKLYGTTEDVSNGERRSARKLRTFMVFRSIEEKCIICNLTEWQGKPLRLDIDHIDGNCVNNRLDNLQFICPNCHRQKTIPISENKRRLFVAERFKEREPKIQKTYICSCGENMSPTAKTCQKCRNHSQFNWPPNEILSDIIWKKSKSELAKELGVSDVAIAKHCKKQNIILPNSQYRRYFYLGDFAKCEEIKEQLLNGTPITDRT